LKQAAKHIAFDSFLRYDQAAQRRVVRITVRFTAEAASGMARTRR
jgi:hypothetical protein